MRPRAGGARARGGARAGEPRAEFRTVRGLCVGGLSGEGGGASGAGGKEAAVGADRFRSRADLRGAHS